MKYGALNVPMEFVRYCIAGAFAGVTLLVLLALLVETTPMPPVAASAVSFAIAVLVNYVLQYRYTFAANDNHSSALPKFGAIACIGLVINTGLFWVFDSVAGLPYLVAQIIATGVVVLFNYSMNRRYVFVEQQQ